MASPYLVAVEGYADALRQIQDLDGAVSQSARQAVNRTIDWARTRSAEEIMRQVNFGKEYLTGRDGRLQVRKKARGDDLEAVLVGRQRATSLARFTDTRDPGVTRREGGVRVEVKPGSEKFMKRAFLMRLRAGSQLTDTKYNLGLAIRLRPGEKLANKTRIQQINTNLFLLYGPSVDQVFRTVAPEIAPRVESYLETEFLRLLEVQRRG
ncbi:hypothetical protein ADP64_000021 [Achromobacter phage phiAxp-2]|uniref:Minor tail protein Z n=1 Tax=Achromobacter phage phiAxp-2 TaxID=1664246 RepID=A0A0K2FI54_9CAUD|nr:tail completion or Neck1 protein [Achromobacter phage phiAxp-2]ALA45449.1 hypothetical protein ADP64_000021 [Achromobacter phage phiAxp-2]